MKKDTEYFNNLANEAKSDPDAFNEIYDYFYDRLLNYAFRRTLSIAEAQDIVSNAFYKVVTKIDGYNSKKGSLNSWIYKIVSNEINMFFRKTSKYQVKMTDEIQSYLENIEDEDANEAEKSLMQNEDYQVLAKAIRRLKPVYQELIHLKYFEELENSEIARVTKVKENSLRVYLHRALKELKNVLIEDGETFLQQEKFLTV